MLKVVNGTKLQGTVVDSDSPGFFGISGRKTEKEYYQLLLDSQDYFDLITSGRIAPEDHFIFSVHNNAFSETVDGYLLYVWHPIRVRPVANGYIYCSNDGRHRCTVAQKYHLNLLVDVIPNYPPPISDEPYNPF